MQSELKKVVYRDNDKDIGIIGTIVYEDDYFLNIQSRSGRIYQIGKRAIVVIKHSWQPGGNKNVS